MVTSSASTRGSAPFALSAGRSPRRRPPNWASAGVAAAATMKPNAARLFIADRELERLRALLGGEEPVDAAHRLQPDAGDLGKRLQALADDRRQPVEDL